MSEPTSSSQQDQTDTKHSFPLASASITTPRFVGNGRYRVLRLHASGGMARVYLASDIQLGRQVAIKVLAPELLQDTVRVERFRLEARRVAALRHPQIVPLLDYGEEGSILYLVMPFYPHTLRDEFEKRKVFRLAEVVNVSTQVAAALDHAHQYGLIHRDIKPENILLDEAGNALLGDFGIAKADYTAPRKLATSGPLAAAEAGRARLATIEYSAPEYLMSQPIDRRADVYGLGIVVYEMLTGHVPYQVEGERVTAAILRILTEPTTPPSFLAPASLPLTTDAVVLGALEKDARQRYGTPGEFSRALAQTLLNPAGLVPFDYSSLPPSRLAWNQHQRPSSSVRWSLVNFFRRQKSSR
jgi:serine/threonine protein kinase